MTNMHSLNEIYPDKEKDPIFARNQPPKKSNFYLTKLPECTLSTHNFQSFKRL